jgi:hypothetical protein
MFRKCKVRAVPKRWNNPQMLENPLPYFRKLPTSRREILFELTYYLICRSRFAILLVDADA